MGKGGGCVPSKKKVPSAATQHDDHRGSSNPPPIPVEDELPETNATAETTTTSTATPAPTTITTTSRPIEKLKIFVVFYSMYGHVEGLARRMKKGVDGVEGVEGVLYRVPETLTSDVLDQMKAPPKDDGIPEITAAELATADGFLFGFPTRYGCMAAQMKAFFDSTGQLWREQRLAGKPAGFFVSTGTQGGGQETTA
jgi:NAD(P)H dehydrogenase (quinone)